MELPVIPRLYDRPFPVISKPQIIGYTGLNNLKFAKNMSSRCVNFDLNYKNEEDIHKPETLDPKLIELLKFLQDTSATLDLSSSTKLEDSKFFSYRGLLTCISSTPYEFKEPWKVAVMLFKGNIYLCMRDTDYKINKVAKTTEYDHRSTAGGFKFEQYVFSDTPDSQPNYEEPVNQFKELNLFFKTRLNRHTLVYGAEVDGAACDIGNVTLPPKNGSTEEILQYLRQLEFVEAKTNLHFHIGKGVRVTFERHKCRKWWCQSFLVGINRIICGFKSKQGIVESLKVFTLKDLENSQWKPNVCINFLDSFLTYVKDCLKEVITRKHGKEALNNINNLDMALLLEWSPKHDVTMTENWEDKDGIISKWYRDSFVNREESTESHVKDGKSRAPSSRDDPHAMGRVYHADNRYSRMRDKDSKRYHPYT